MRMDRLSVHSEHLPFAGLWGQACHKPPSPAEAGQCRIYFVSYLIDNNKLQSIAATETASSFETIASRTQDIHQLTEELTGLVSSLAQSNEAIVDSIQTISAATEEVTAHSSVTLESSEENSSIVVEVGDIVGELQALAERLSALS